jgi:hypothetical protein
LSDHVEGRLGILFAVAQLIAANRFEEKMIFKQDVIAAGEGKKRFAAKGYMSSTLTESRPPSRIM